MIKKYWFFMGMAVMAGAAVALPEIGPVIKQYHILNIGIFLAFLLTGMSLETSSVLKQIKDVRVLAAALVSSLIFFPAAAFYAARFFLGDWPDFVMGALIIGAAPVHRGLGHGHDRNGWRQRAVEPVHLRTGQFCRYSDHPVHAQPDPGL